MIDKSLAIHLTADVAVIQNPKFVSKPTGFEYTCFNHTDIADNSWLATNLHAMDIASFIGFPGKKGKPWYDEKWNLAIARSANIASLPYIGFTNSSIPTSDAMLVSGLSFSGSSGSAVISHQKGIQVGPGLSGSNYVPPKVVGIMSGHWWDEDDPEPFRHSGLSYLTSSSAILSLMA